MLKENSQKSFSFEKDFFYSNNSIASTLPIPPLITTNKSTFSHANRREISPPVIAELMLLVEYKIPGNIKALKAATGMNSRVLLKKGGIFIFCKITTGSILGR